MIRPQTGSHITDAILAAAVILIPPLAFGMAFDTSAAAIATWVGAMATTGALIAAIYAGHQAAKIVQVERERDDRIEDKERRAQAEQIAGWVSNKNHLNMVNLSNLPVYEVQVRYELGELDATEEYGALVPSTREGGSRQVRSFDMILRNVLQTLPPTERPRPRVTVWFTDTAGIRWERDGHGTLRECPEST
ncbi:hypothetical protein [Nocardioides jejuensis]|uniref:Uncharacterized protein n=1 Tax=Nocardioides jejuensis TaxID=2502782 RepID=A0A4R1BY96_9ACTN|nr:hypothetical protein [Nocardioides jejuensis]TCJ23033.1 hypothetical protein EPD65_11770 [Nocardioides jejuensis]